MTDDSTKLYVNEKVDEERDISDSRYAIKLVERIVFGAIGLVSLTVLGALIALVIKQ